MSVSAVGASPAFAYSPMSARPANAGRAATGEAASGASSATGLSESDLRLVSELKARDRVVRTHEMAHMAAGAGLVTRGASYTYQNGPDGLARLAAAHPEAAILFSNVLGQLAAPAEDWRRLIARHLSGHAWASYHDVISTARPPQQRQARTLTEPHRLEATLAHFWTGGEIALTDHETLHLGGKQSCRYAVWPITPKRWHLVEWAVHTPSPRTSTGELSG